MHPYSGTDSGFQVGDRSISQKKKKKNHFSINKLSTKTHTQNYYFLICLDTIIYQ